MFSMLVIARRKPRPKWERKRLKPEAVPSVFPFACKNELPSTREQRYSKRVKCDTDQSENVFSSECVVNENVPSSECVVNEVVVESTQEVSVDCDSECYRPKILGPAAHDLNLKSNFLSPQDQLFLVMMKLRQAKEDIELSYLFQVSESTVSNIIGTWINFMYYQLKELNIWPSRSVIDEYMPDDFFANFNKTRVILDATEVPINKPQNVNAQSASFSNYKNKNTLKVMIGCTPRGTVSYISDAYCGATSDRQIIERSDLLLEKDKFQDHDSIMADRGIMVQDLFASRNIQVNTPTMIKGKSQLEAQVVVKDRRIASKRIHVERIIGLAKTFKILKKELPGKAILGSRIIFICFSELNFRPCIVEKYSL
ncbi:uncharacterized protein LOC134247520 [Saccostrea cucullata]|uniref:uncharacterized protein LOC134247520 n=1 Tax=Saccostrea cuccullata TaxID=36930 RepID=UPI002ED5A808